MRGASGHIACYIFEEKRVNHAICPPFKILSIRPFIIATQLFMSNIAFVNISLKNI